MKIEIINKPMLCWDNDEKNATEWHVLAKVTECDTIYLYKVISNKKTGEEEMGRNREGLGAMFKNAKPLTVQPSISMS